MNLFTMDLIHCKLSFLENLVSRMHLDIMRIEFGSGILYRELPINLDVFGHPFCKEGEHFVCQFFHRRNTAVQTQASQCRELNLNHIEPTRRFGRVKELKALRKGAGFICRKVFVKGTHIMRIEVILHHAKFDRLREGCCQGLHEQSVFLFRAASMHLTQTIPGQRLNGG